MWSFMNKASLSKFVSILFVSLLFPNASFSGPASQNVQILIKEIKPRPTHPRTNERIIITCIYDDIAETLLLHFLENIGGVTITVTNTTSGESFFQTCSSTPNTCALSLSGEQGEYTIEIEDDNGSYYKGSFILD